MALTSSDPSGNRRGAAPLRWRVIETPPAAGAYNMGMDMALARRVGSGGVPVLRLYRWTPMCLSLGRNQPADGCYDPSAIRRHGLDVVRRPTGGRAVLHSRELTYSVAVPYWAFGSARAAYRRINEALVAGLKRLGVDVRIQPGGGPAAAPSVRPCFAEPAEGEIVVGGRKLVGSAQVRIGSAILQHGSILFHDDQALLAEITAISSPVTEPPATLAALLPRVPEWGAVVAAIVDGWGEAMGPHAHPGPPSRAEHDAALAEALNFQRDDWTWRR